MRPRIGSLGLEHLPPARPGVAQGGRRVAGAADVVVAGREVEREVDRGGEPLVPVLLEQELVGAVEELAGRQRAQQPAQGPAQQEGAGAGALALAGDVDDRHLEATLDARGDDEVARERGAPGRPQLAGGVPLRGQVGDPALAQDPVAQVDEHHLALDAGHAEARAAEGRQQHHEPEAEDDDHGEGDADVDVPGSARPGPGRGARTARTTAAVADRAPGSTAPSAPAGSREGRRRSNSQMATPISSVATTSSTRVRDPRGTSRRRGCTERWRTHARAPPALPVPLVGDRRARERNFG